MTLSRLFCIFSSLWLVCSLRPVQWFCRALVWLYATLRYATLRLVWLYATLHQRTLWKIGQICDSEIPHMKKSLLICSCALNIHFKIDVSLSSVMPSGFERITSYICVLLPCLLVHRETITENVCIIQVYPNRLINFGLNNEKKMSCISLL